MEIRNLNLLPELIASGEITKEEGLKLLASFVCNNYPIFGLHKYDEDFRSEIFIKVLEKGNKLFDTFNPQSGDFFTFTYCFIKSQIKQTTKTNAKKIIKEKVYFEQSVEHYISDDNNTMDIFSTYAASANPPYSYKKISLNALKEGIKANKLEKYDRSILVLALKAAFYLNDTQIQKLSNIYEIDLNLLYDLIQYFREEIFPKYNTKQKLIERRNSAYFLHKKYIAQLTLLDSKENINRNFEREDIQKRNEYQVHNLNALNKKFNEGYLFLRPQTKIVADVLGICERQVNYYLHCLRKGKIDKKLLEKIKEQD